MRSDTEGKSVTGEPCVSSEAGGDAPGFNYATTHDTARLTDVMHLAHVLINGGVVRRKLLRRVCTSNNDVDRHWQRAVLMPPVKRL